MSNPRHHTQTAGHRYALQRLSSYIDGQLSEQERERVQVHLRACPDCREQLRILRWTKDLSRQMPVMPVPRSFIIREADLEARPAAAGWPRLLPSLAGLQTAAAIVAVLLVLVVAGDLWMGGGVPIDQPAPMLSMKAEVAETITLVAAAPMESAKASSAHEQPNPLPDPQRITSVNAATTTAVPDVAALGMAEPTATAMTERNPTLPPHPAQTSTPAGFSSQVTSTKSLSTLEPTATVTIVPTHTPTTEPTPTPEPTATPVPPLAIAQTATPQQLAAVPEAAALEEAQIEEQSLPRGEDASFGAERHGSSWRFAQIALGVVLVGLLIAIVWLRRWGRFG